MSSETENFRRCMEAFGPDQEDVGAIELGTVGWDDGQQQRLKDSPWARTQIIWALDGRSKNRPLVKVTLYRGYRPGVDKKPRDGRACQPV